MKAYRILAHTIAGCVVLQAMWVALSYYTTLNDAANGTVITSDYRNFGGDLHNAVAIGLSLLSLGLLVLSFFASVPGGTKFAAILLGLVVLQWVLAFISFGVPEVGPLHGLNAFAILGVAEFAARRVSAPAAVEAPAAAAV